MPLFLLLLALLGCGEKSSSEKSPAKPAADGASLGDLLTIEPTGAPPGAAPPTPPAGTAPGEGATAPTASSTVSETPECNKAREAYKAKRVEVDGLRSTIVPDEEKNMVSARATYETCSVNMANCGIDDPKKLLELKTRADAAESRYQAALRKVSEAEAGLFPFDQAVDKNCGRQ